MLFLLFIFLLSGSFAGPQPLNQKRAKEIFFFPSPAEDIWGMGGQGRTMEKEGDSQELWVKMGQWSWLLSCKELLQVWPLKEEPERII